jgi:hypothetical protein
MSEARSVRPFRAIGYATIAALLIASSLLPARAQNIPGVLAAQSSTETGVTIKVTPKTIGPSVGHWEFSVVLDSHSADLTDDLVQSARLTTDEGHSFEPRSWTGAAPGGHHREGILIFDAPTPRPSSIELKIVRRGESAPRTFRWQL